MLTLADLVEGLTGRRPPNWEQKKLTEVVIDSRLARPGSLFVALKGEREDGHDFVADAFERGAIAAIVERRLDVGCTRVIGVTGSVGKTTTKEVIYGVLCQSFRTLKSEGNYNNEIGLPLTLLKLEPGYERVVLEMAMYDLGEIAELAAIARPHIGVVTNVGPTHLERLGTIERIAQAKTELVEALPDDGVAILNGDDPWVRQMADKTRAEVFFYGLNPECDLWANHIESYGLEGIRFRFHSGSEIIHAKVPLLGRHSVHTALAAASVGLVEGQSWEEIMEGLRGASQLRLVVVPGIGGTTILDDTYGVRRTEDCCFGRYVGTRLLRGRGASEGRAPGHGCGGPAYHRGRAGTAHRRGSASLWHGQGKGIHYSEQRGSHCLPARDCGPWRHYPDKRLSRDENGRDSVGPGNIQYLISND